MPYSITINGELGHAPGAPELRVNGTESRPPARLGNVVWLELSD